MRKLFVIGAVVVVLVIVAVALVVTNLEGIANTHKDTILTRVKTQLGRDVGVGNIGITLRSGLGVRLENVTIGEDPAFGTEPFLQASDLQVNVRLLPLLKKEFQVKKVILREPVIRIVKNKNGVLNTQSLTKPAETAQAAGPQGAGEPSTAAIPLVVSLASIENGEVDYIDETQGFGLRIRKIDTSAKDLDFKKPLSIDLEAALLADDQNVKVRGTVGPIPMGTLEAGAGAVSIPVDLEADIDPVELAAVMKAFPRVAASIPKDVRVAGPVNAHLTAKGSTTETAVSLSLDGSRIDAELPQGTKKSPGVPLLLDMKGRYTPTKVLIETATVRFASAELQAHGEYALTQPPSLGLDIDSKDVSLSGWDTIVPMAAPYRLSGKVELGAHVEGTLGPGQIPSVTGKAKIVDGSATVPQAVKPVTGIAAEMSFTQKRADVERASLELGGSRVEGHATIDSFDPLTLSYVVTSPSLALADVAPPQPTVKKPEHLDNLTAKGRLTVDPVKKEPSGEGTVTSPSGSVGNIDYNGLEASYSIAGNTVHITDMKARALDGELAGSGSVTTTKEGSSFDFQLAADKVDITEALTSLPGAVQKVLSGRASLNLKISGNGKEWPDIQKTLKGSGLADLSDGEILDVNFASAIFDEIGKYIGNANLIPAQLKSKYPSVFERRGTSFKDLKSDFVIENGKLLARNLQLKHDDYGIRAKGSIGFDKSLDVAATFIVSKKLADDLARSYQAVSYLQNPQGEIELPLMIGGALPNVSVKPDTDFLKNVAGKGIVEKGIDALKKEGLKDLLPFGKKTAPPDSAKTKP
jgi:uncharacterized protein involved in outer membrane biogenesis